MEIEYSRGRRITPLVHEMTPLEAAIARFECEASTYFKKREREAPKGESEPERQSREEALSATLNHLKSERRKIKVFAEIQARLREYQNWGREKSEEDPLALLDEPHHPTTVLARNMRADGRPQPSNRHSPHHIVLCKGRQPSTVTARLTLHMNGVRINDPDNGVWMPRAKADKGHWSMPNAPAHSEIHTYNYESWISFIFERLDSEVVVRSALTRVKILLRDGRQPKQVTAPKDLHWRPGLP